ncbi:MAG: hypothetical protein KAU07_01190 [Candidatus Andersenbacteria bacterium]|nr:hypothetical protein [Candidatus Andersenbacteria bacterium]
MESNEKKIEKEVKDKIERLLVNRKKDTQDKGIISEKQVPIRQRKTGELSESYGSGDYKNGSMPEGEDFSSDDFRSQNRGIKKRESPREKYNRIKKSAKKNTERVKNAPENIRKNMDRARKIPENVRAKAEKIKKMREKFRKESLQNSKKNFKKEMKKRVAAKKAVLKKGLKKRFRAKAAERINNPYMSCLFMIMMSLAFINDVALDVFIALTLQVVGLVISLTGIGAVAGLSIIAFVEAAGNIIDTITGIILVSFSLLIGGTTKGGTKAVVKKFAKTLIKYGGAFVVEFVPFLNLFISWMVVVAWDYFDLKKEADKAEQAGGE